MDFNVKLKKYSIQLDLIPVLKQVFIFLLY